MYSNYIFDLYGTLVDIKTNENSKILWEKLALFYSLNGASYDAQSLKVSYKNKVKDAQLSINNTDYPDFPIETIFESLFKDKNIHISLDTLKATAQMFRILSIKHLRLYDGVLDLLSLLKQRKKKIFLLSNAQRVFTLYEMKVLGIDKYFDGILFSSDYFVCKPDAKFYNKLLDKFNIDIKSSIMVGNDPIADIEGSNNIGLDSLYINSNLSPKITNNLKSNYVIMNGDINRIIDLIIS